MQVSAMGIGWYEREDYPRILKVMEDGHTLPRTYDDFLKRAELGERALKSQGHVVVRAVIKSDDFVIWCRDRGLKVDSEARKRFGNEVAYAEVMKRQGGAKH